MAVKDSWREFPGIEWPEDLKTRKPEALAKAREELKEDISFYAFQQFWFYRQWSRLKKYANDRGIKIIGDLPIYVAFDGADAWANPDLFQFDEEATPAAVAGCPPDAFSATGQLLYNGLQKPFHECNFPLYGGKNCHYGRLQICWKSWINTRFQQFNRTLNIFSID